MLVGMAATVWIGVRGWQARTALTTAIPQVEELQRQVLSGDLDGAQVTLDALQLRTERARSLTSDPIWRIAAHLPWVGRNLSAVGGVARGVDDLADLVMPPVVASSGRLDLSALRPVKGRIDLAPLEAIAPMVAKASDAAALVSTGLDTINTDGLLDLIAGPVMDVQDRVRDLALTMRTGDRAARLLPPMLGADGPRRYLLLLQTNAELRATGGLPGAMTVITADDGVIQVADQVTAGGMPRYDEPVIDLAAEDTALFSDRLGRYMGDVNLTPDFPTAAAVTWEMWRRDTGEELDGVLATDPVALSYLLGATGPVDDGMGGQLTAADAVHVLLSAAYERYPEPTDQDAYFQGVAVNVFNAFVTGAGSPAAAMPALARAAGEHRLLVWSAHRDERAELAGTVLAGTMPTEQVADVAGSTSAVGVFFNDGTGSKMDYYLDTDVELVGSRCEAGTIVYTVRATVASVAPADGAASLPAAVTGLGTHGVPKGSIGTNIVVLGALDGLVTSVMRDGHQLGVAAYTQGDRPAAVVTVELAPGESAMLEFELTDPVPAEVLAIWSTPTRNKTGVYRESLSAAPQC
jgi:hypothetical protein